MQQSPKSLWARHRPFIYLFLRPWSFLQNIFRPVKYWESNQKLGTGATNRIENFVTLRTYMVLLNYEYPSFLKSYLLPWTSTYLVYGLVRQHGEHRHNILSNSPYAMLQAGMGAKWIKQSLKKCLRMPIDLRVWNKWKMTPSRLILSACHKNKSCRPSSGKFLVQVLAKSCSLILSQRPLSTIHPGRKVNYNLHSYTISSTTF